MRDYTKSQNKGSENTRKVFFALWPEEKVRQQIVNTFACSAKNKIVAGVMHADNLHITLHFIGHVSQQKMACMDKLAQTVKAHKFALTLNHYDYFYRPKVLWMGLQTTPAALTLLHRQVGEALTKCDYQTELRPYAPHLTLLRKFPQPSELVTFEPINWLVKDFVLLESVPIVAGVRYKVLRRYKL
jgi:2'-5' RNA ligase